MDFLSCHTSQSVGTQSVLQLIVLWAVSSLFFFLLFSCHTSQSVGTQSVLQLIVLWADSSFLLFHTVAFSVCFSLYLSLCVSVTPSVSPLCLCHSLCVSFTLSVSLSLPLYLCLSFKMLLVTTTSRATGAITKTKFNQILAKLHHNVHGYGKYTI